MPVAAGDRYHRGALPLLAAARLMCPSGAEIASGGVLPVVVACVPGIGAFGVLADAAANSSRMMARSSSAMEAEDEGPSRPPAGGNAGSVMEGESDDLLGSA